MCVRVYVCASLLLRAGDLQQLQLALLRGNTANLETLLAGQHALPHTASWLSCALLSSACCCLGYSHPPICSLAQHAACSLCFLTPSLFPLLSSLQLRLVP